MRHWFLIFIGCALLGAVTFYLPGIVKNANEEPTETLESMSREALHKKIEKMRLQAIRLASDGRYDEAFPLFLKLIDINQHDQFSYVQLSKVMRDLGEERFLEMLDKSAEQPIAFDIDRTKGAVYYQFGDNVKAKKHLNLYLALAPNDLASKYYLGAIALREGELDRAELLLTDVIEREKTYYFAYLDLLDLYERRGNKELTEKYLKLALKYNPANSKEGVCCGLPLTEEQKKI